MDRNLSSSVGNALPLVSVIVTNYNHGRFLRRRMESILAQTYSRFEVIYIDDGSTDESGEAIAPFRADRRLRCFESERNSGSPFIPLNRGVRMARGELIWVAEADDYADARFLETLVGVVTKHPSVGVAYCQSNEIDENGDFLSTVDYCSLANDERWQTGFVNSGIEECRRYLLYRNTIPNFSAVVFRKDLFEQIGLADETMRLSGDWLVWIKMLALGDIAFVAQPLNYYRQHAAHGASLRRRVDIVSHATELYRVADYCQNHLPFGETEWDVMLTRIMKFWLRSCLEKRPADRRFGNFMRVCKVARGADPRFLGRLLWCLADRVSFGLTLRARSRLGWGALTCPPSSGGQRPPERC